MEENAVERELVAWLRKFDRPRSDKPSGAARRRDTRTRTRAKGDRVWRLNLWQPHEHVQRGRQPYPESVEVPEPWGPAS
jgi:hypothetical protein